MTTNLSFGFERTNEGQATQYRKPTVQQLAYYSRLCAEKKVKRDNIEGYSFEQMSKLIEELRAFYPASEKQVEVIKNKVTKLRELGIDIPPIHFSKFTGGKEGTASKYIETLINKENELRDIMPPSDKQIELLVSMYLCPDIAFEDYGIPRRYDLEGGYWRRLTPIEFAEEIKAKMTHSNASLFIDRYRGQFYTWRTTRITESQIKYVRQLEERMLGITTSETVEFQVDLYGEVSEVISTTSKKYDMTRAYQPLEDIELLMFSNVQATQYIDRLKSELEDSSITKFKQEDEDNLDYLRSTKSQADQLQIDFENLQDLMFKLEAIVGYNDDELHDAITIQLYEGNVNNETYQAGHKKIVEFFKDGIQTGAITFALMGQLAEENETLNKIVKSIFA